MAAFNDKIESLMRDLPDAEGARLFFERLEAEQPQAVRKLARDAGLLSDTLAIASWSPLLATTLIQNPDYLTWLARERTQAKVKSREELNESLARFSLTNSQLEPHVLLSRFRRRELLRIYLHDIRGTSTLVETTEELSNLADAILEHALSLARQEADNRYGPPLRADERGRTAAAGFCVVALGKLGSFELNYASDIDLLFLYDGEGTTSGAGTRGAVTNREYFNRLSEAVARMVGGQSGEGAAYRVDLRLRPFGRDGALASSMDEAARYYREKAQAWELQAMIRARASAGQHSLYADLAERIRDRVYRADETVNRALANVRLAKQKIDRHHAHDSAGFNVKLGRGGIREIEFIAQALQLAFAGRDPWLRAPHTLISLGRLADRGLVTERERTQLSDAYLFLRKLEHRLQMEHGLQTHSVSDEPVRRDLVARRMDFAGADALSSFDHALKTHTTNVRLAYDRIFGVAEDADSANASSARREHGTRADSVAEPTPSMVAPPALEKPFAAELTAIRAAATVFAAHLEDAAGRGGPETDPANVERVARFIETAARESLNARRASVLASRIASSLDKATVKIGLSEESLKALVSLCGASEYFGEMLASNPSLILALPLRSGHVSPRDYRALLSAAVSGEESFGAEMAALRREWARLIVEIGALDAAGSISMAEANARQTQLAEASLDAGCLMAARELARRCGEVDARTRAAVLGLGRLGGGGMDYGSDLDVVLVYDDDEPSPVRSLGSAEAHARFAELLAAALSSVTRDGYLYRVDLRLRPYGRNGPVCTGARAFADYLRERSVEWEWLAYVKLRATAGDKELGERVEAEARLIVHEAARASDQERLRLETRRVRERLEIEKTRGRGRGVDIKYGAGGMLDVYFATRYLQLRDHVPDDAGERSTRGVLERLRATGSLGGAEFEAMSEGYALLRRLDHHLRLMVGRSTRLPAPDHPALRDLARVLGYPSAAELLSALTARMRDVRAAYDGVTEAVVSNQ